MQYLNIIVTVLVTLASIIQGVDAGLNLWSRWKESRVAKNDGSDRVSYPEHREPAFRLSQKSLLILVFGIFYYLVVAFEVLPLWHYASLRALSNKYIYTLMYLTFLIKIRV